MTFRFAHAFFRQTLYEETFAPRRIRMHQQVGRALEEAYTSRLEEHADELAEHFSQSTELEDLEKALKYGEMAARRAKSVYAWSEAARLLDQALQVQEVLNPDDKARRCDLLLDLGDALLPAGEGGRVVETVAPEAFALAEALNDRTRAVRACWTASMGLFRVYGPVEGMRQKWFQAMDRYAAPRTRERVFADIGMSVVAREEGRSAEATALIRGALDLARRLDDPDLIVLAMTVLMLWEAFRREGWRLAQELAGLSRAGVSPIHLGYMLVTGGWVHLAHGERDKFEELSGELADLAERTRDTQVLLWSLGRDILPRTLDGRFDDALADYDGVLERAEELGLEGRARIMAGLHTPRPLMYLGRPEEALAAVAPRPAPWPGVRAACLAHAGRPGEARDAISEEMQKRAIGPEEDKTPDLLLAFLLEVAEDRGAAELLAGRLAALADLYLVYLPVVAWLLGRAAALLGKPEEARAQYDKALEVAGRIRHRPEIALTHLELAELLLDHYPEEPDQAQEHLDKAISELRDMKMQPFLERALSHREILSA